MSIACQRLKINWLFENLGSDLVAVVEKSLSEAWKAVGDRKEPSRPIFDAVLVYGAYAVARHRTWCRTPLFRTILIDAISRDCDIDRNIASVLVESVIDVFDLEACIQPRSDREFLLYILVQATSLGDEAGVQAEIGLGREILLKLKGAADVSDAMDEAVHRFVFLPEIDGIFCDILRDLSAQLKGGSWAMDCYRLEFLIGGLPGGWQDLNDQSGYEWLVKAICDFDLKNGEDLGSIEEKVNTVCRVLGLSPPPDLSVEDLVNYLERKQLVYCLESTQGRKKPERKWYLTLLGEELTSNAFAANFLGRGGLEEGGLQRLSGFRQAAVVRAVPKKSVSSILKMLSSPLPIHSEAIGPAVSRLKDLVDHEILSRVLIFRIKTSSTPAARAAACRASGSVEATESLVNILKEISVVDPSTLVKESAVQALQRQNPCTIGH